MLQSRSYPWLAGLTVALALASGVATWNAGAQPKRKSPDCPYSQGQHGSGGGSADHRADMKTIHALFADPSIRRMVRHISGGVETATESDTTEGAANIQKHVAAMYARMTTGEPIHARDPLFAELFKHADEITMVIENTARGVNVRETSTDPYVTKLIRAHAAVVTKLIANGRHEMHLDHAPPAH